MAVCAGCRSVVEEDARFCPQCGAPILPMPRRLGPGAELAVEDFGRVVLGHELGEGGMGIVYRAWLYYDPERAARRDRAAPGRGEGAAPALARA
jgi:hypothetical protein